MISQVADPENIAALITLASFSTCTTRSDGSAPSIESLIHTNLFTWPDHVESLPSMMLLFPPGGANMTAAVAALKRQRPVGSRLLIFLA